MKITLYIYWLLRQNRPHMYINIICLENSLKNSRRLRSTSIKNNNRIRVHVYFNYVYKLIICMVKGRKMYKQFSFLVLNYLCIKSDAYKCIISHYLFELIKRQFTT